MSENSTYVNKYVCFGLSDGSFSWGRIKAEGVVNTPNGDKEVFVLTERMTCYVPKGDLAQNSIRAVSRRISAGTSGPIALPGRTDPESLPDYQKGGYSSKALPEKSEGCKNASLPVKVQSNLPEVNGVPELSEVMDIQQSNGLNVFQKVGNVQSSIDPTRKIGYIFRKYGYDTNIRKDQLNLDEEGGDIIDREILGLEDLTDDELFLIAMKSKMSGIGLNQGAQNMLAMGLSPVPDEEIESKAVAILKDRRGFRPE